jgi:hypothetical protein
MDFSEVLSVEGERVNRSRRLGIWSMLNCDWALTTEGTKPQSESQTKKYKPSMAVKPIEVKNRRGRTVSRHGAVAPIYNSIYAFS